MLAAGIASAAHQSPPGERESAAASGADGLAFLELSEAGNSS